VHWKRIGLGVVLVVVVGLFFGLGLQDQLTFEAVKTSQAHLQELYRNTPWTVLLGFLAIYLIIVPLNLPGATILGLVAGAIFGSISGTIIVSFASSIGATMACLLSRFFLRDWVKLKFPQAVAKVDQGIAREGAFYLFSLRLIPAIPFFMINLVMGLTGMRLRTFYWVSQLGMLPGTFVYVNAGSELGRLTSAAGIFSPRMLIAFALLGLFPLAGKKALNWYRRKAVQAGTTGDGFLEGAPMTTFAPFGPPSPESATEGQSIASGCNECGACVAQCPFLAKYGTPAAIARGILAETNSVDPFECSLCNVCGAVCPEKLSPADMFLAMRRQAAENGNVDLSRYAPLIKYEQRGHSDMFAWYSPEGAKSVFFPGCTLPGTRPEITRYFFEQLRKLIPDLGIVLDCCHKPSHDLGRQEFFIERFESIRNRLVDQGVAEVLVACPNCFKVFARYGSPLKITTVYEALARNVQPIPATLNEQVVLHDPCPLRNEDAIQSSVRTLLAAQGLTVRKMKYSGRRTLCCGEGGGVGFHNPGFAKSWAEKRKQLAGDDRIVTYCAGCAEFLGRIAPVCHLGEILYEPERALAGQSKVSSPPMTYVNRLLLKRWLKKFVSSPQVPATINDGEKGVDPSEGRSSADSWKKNAPLEGDHASDSFQARG
jgi:uncharacterized membrane protein YdjX (TVP38/TMEM64 family)/Fe-S oxidoreductase